jgi:hypothetical protein
MTDRELIERLLFLAETAEDYFIYRELRELKAAALEAQPEPQGPTDEELLETVAEAVGYEHVPTDEICLALARAVLARWGRPAIQPVPVSERLPEPQGPTVMQILALSDEIEAEELGTIDLVRRALARWGRPAIEPVPGAKGE